MPLVVKDRVMETTSSTGTGTITLGGAVAGFQSFSVIGNGNTTYYAIVGGTEWEIGLGTYTSSGTTLSRDTVLESSNSGSLVNFSAGTKNVFVTYAAEKSVYKEANDYVYLPSNLEFTGTGNRITGDFSNATHVNRVAFQSSTTNGATSVFIIPNGTSTNANLVVANASDPTNSSFGQLVVNNTDVRLFSGILGTGSYLPMTFYTGGSEKLRIDTSGNVGIGATNPVSRLSAPAVGGTVPTFTIPDGTNNRYSVGIGSINVGGVGQRMDFYAGDSGANGTNLGSGALRMSITATGNVGIGTANPTRKLQVEGTSYFSDTMQLPSSWGSNYIQAGTGDGADFNTYNVAINSWWGIGFRDYQNLNAVKAYIDTRTGSMGLQGNLLFNSGYGSAAIAYGCRAWINFDGTTTPPTYRGGGNFSTTITRTATGNFTVTFSTAMPDTNYTVTFGSGVDASSGSGDCSINLYGVSTTGFSFNLIDATSNTAVNRNRTCLAVFR